MNKKKMISKGLILSLLLLVATIYAIGTQPTDKQCYEVCMRNNAGMFERFTSMFIPSDQHKNCMFQCSQVQAPEICPTDYSPVCGFDGITYSNKCMAKLKGITIKHEGKCEAVIKPLICCQTYLPIPGSANHNEFEYRWMHEDSCRLTFSSKQKIVDDKNCEDADADKPDVPTNCGTDSMITVTHSSGSTSSFCTSNSIAEWIESLGSY